MYISHSRTAELREKKKQSSDEVIESYLAAHLTVPRRSEAVYRIMCIKAAQREFRSAFEFGRMIINNQYSVHDLFALRNLYDYECRRLMMICAFNTKEMYGEVFRLGMELFLKKTMPPTLTEGIQKHMKSIMNISGRIMSSKTIDSSKLLLQPQKITRFEASLTNPHGNEETLQEGETLLTEVQQDLLPPASLVVKEKEIKGQTTMATTTFLSSLPIDLLQSLSLESSTNRRKKKNTRTFDPKTHRIVYRDPLSTKLYQ